MKRDLYDDLLAWKQQEGRKPLVLRGARQVGKTYLLKEFGRREFAKTIYLNFEQNPAFAEFFAGKLDPQAIVEKLSLYFGTEIRPEEALLVFDEIQECPEALAGLKFFQEEAPAYHVAAAGSLLGLKLNKPTAFPVGKVTFLDLHPMTFGEFLEAAGKGGLRRLISEKHDFEPLEAAFHDAIMDLLRKYYFVGGMPEATAGFIAGRDPREIRGIQNDILEAHLHDFRKHTGKAEAVRLARVWDVVPAQLARENKKWRYADVAKHARARDYAEGVQWLTDAGLVLRSYRIAAPRLPLAGYKDEDAFKLYLLDVGLLGARLGISEKTIVSGNELFVEYHGAFAENFAAQELAAARKRLFYWTSNAIAEVDFLVEDGEKIFPLEVKAGKSAKKKSLRVYGNKYAPPVLSRATAMNLKLDGAIANYPLYAVSRFPMTETTPRVS